MKNLIIIGARGYGRVVYNLAKECKDYNVGFRIKGFLDDKTDALAGKDDIYSPILSSVEDYEVQPDDVFVCALGNVHFKEKYIKILLEKGGCFINIIHKTAIILDDVKLGIGNIIGPFVVLQCGTRIGDYNTFLTGSVIGHDSKIGDYSMFETYSVVCGSCLIGNSVTLHTHSMLHPKKQIGDYSTIGAGSVAYGNVRENTTVIGNPARKLNY